MSQNKNIHAVFKSKSVIWATVAFICISLIGAVIFSFMLLKDSVADASAENAALVILGIGAVISGIVSGLINKNKGIQIGVLCAAVQIILLILFSVIFREKTPVFCADNWIEFAVIILFNAIGGIIGVNIKKKY